MSGHDSIGSSHRPLFPPYLNEQSHQAEVPKDWPDINMSGHHSIGSSHRPLFPPYLGPHEVQHCGSQTHTRPNTMHSLKPSSLLLLLGASLSAASVVPPRGGKNGGCSAIDFLLSATADNNVYTNAPDPNNVDEILQFLTDAFTTGTAISGTTPVTGHYTIHAVYCKPAKKVKKHADTLQLLVHGVTYNSTMWEGYGFGDQYNWHAYFNAQGYATLAIDRLGHGLSSRPDPLTVVQGAMHVEVIHQLITSVKTNSASNALDKGYSDIVYVGHSFGSQIGSQVLHLHPSDITAAILTGYSTFVNFTGIRNTFQWQPATLHDPSRFPSLPLGYVTIATEASRTVGFYGSKGTYDPAMAHFDFAHEDTFPDGEMGSTVFLAQPARGYTNPVLVVTGTEDAIFCPDTKAECEKALANTGTTAFPDVPPSKFAYYAPVDTGHDLTLHYSAPNIMKRVHKWLEHSW
ncbi:Alpha/Beta hydrolase protein [Apodospora peruviana]|uniref:Alpha/Beta hydrolase protein n=1 Tax=Apodospora peruviana TaxID=516989 RepID=A0AAE0HWG4_9PEZI|nr:Alpha/Beta hydrolase protein [Apodospora peruviana]